MPITEIRLRNFRCFADSRPIPIKPLTVVFGRNNSGKSSILYSLLLLRQTLDSPEYGQRLNMRGPLYPAGTFADVVHQHFSKENITMEFGVRCSTPVVDCKLDLEFSSGEPQPPRLVRLSVDPGDGVRLEIRRGPGRGGPYELLLDGKSLGGERAANFLFPVNQFLPLIGDEPPRRGRPSPKQDETRRTARRILKEFEASLLGIRAVGAFRTAPERRYDYQGRPPELVDLRGENVVHALIEDGTRRGKRPGELLRAVNQWLSRVGRVKLMPLKRLSPTARLYEVRLRDIDSGRWANFADVGFGIGQAFPVLVEGLRTPIKGTFIVQEPEIHLHPDAQLAMADFLITLARSRRNVIVETHSEAVLLRVRRAILDTESHSGFGANDVCVIHVSKQKDGSSVTRVLEVDQLGQIQDWPKGFMEELTTERMAILESTARQSE